jgi:hypothetical protein
MPDFHDLKTKNRRHRFRIEACHSGSGHATSPRERHLVKLIWIALAFYGRDKDSSGHQFANVIGLLLAPIGTGAIIDFAHDFQNIRVKSVKSARKP